MSGVFINPVTGNREVWNECPEGYLTEEEWNKLNNTEKEESITLEEAVALAKSAIKNDAEQLISEGIVIQSSLGFPIKTGEASARRVESRIYCLSTALERDTMTIPFRDENNEYHEISYKDLNTILYEISDFSNNVMDAKWRVEKEIDAAKTPEEVFAVEVNFPK